MKDIFKCVICNTIHESGEKYYPVKDNNGIYQPTCSKECAIKAKNIYSDRLKNKLKEIENQELKIEIW